MLYPANDKAKPELPCRKITSFKSTRPSGSGDLTMKSKWHKVSGFAVGISPQPGQTLRDHRRNATLAWRKTIPWSLVVFRALLGPVLVLAAFRPSVAGLWLGAMVAAGFLSDIYDGVLARRWNTATSALRRADSAVDVLFYLGVLSALIVRHGHAIRERIGLLAAVIALELLNCLFGLIKFRRMPSYHSYSARLWGALLAASTIILLSFNRSRWLVTLALVWGIASELESLAMTALLPQWMHDVKTLAQALAIRREMLSSSVPQLAESATIATQRTMKAERRSS